MDTDCAPFFVSVTEAMYLNVHKVAFIELGSIVYTLSY